VSDLNASFDAGVATLELNRPAVLNALSPDVLHAIIAACDDITGRDDLRVVLLRGAGRCFSAGADLPAFGEHFEAGSVEISDLGRLTADTLAALPQITVAAIHGHCVGGAIVMAAACDLRIAAQGSRFSIPEVDAGIPLAWGGMGYLYRLIGETLATDLVLSCRPFGADEAKSAGFLTDIVDDADFEQRVSDYVSGVAARPAIVLRTMKQQLIALRDGRFDATKDAEALIAARQDPEAQRIGEAYIASRIRKKD